MLRERAKKAFAAKIYPILISLRFQILLYILFWVWYFCHPLISFFELKARGTFFDENALLPYGSPQLLTRSILHSAEKIHLDFLKEVVQPIEEIEQSSYGGTQAPASAKPFRKNGCGLASYQAYLRMHKKQGYGPCKAVVDWVNRTMARIVRDDNTFEHNFKDKDRRPLSPGNLPLLPHKNVYGILYPKRAADRKENIVLTASFSTLYRTLASQKGGFFVST